MLSEFNIADRGQKFGARKKPFAFLGLFFVALFSLIFFSKLANAVEPISISNDLKAIDLTHVGDRYFDEQSSLRVSTAPDRDGIVRRVEIRPQIEGRDSNWYVFALANDTNEQIDRLIVAPHYQMVDSGLIWPDLDTKRIITITPSEGFSLDVQEDREADVFLVTLDPGAVITLIAELKTKKLPKLTLWEPEAYKDTINSFTLYRGIVLGISGLLAVFLTILFVVKGSAIFPATAALAWGVLAYICVDFGFWDRIVKVTQTGEQIWRAGTEVVLAISLLLFYYAYLRINRWNRQLSALMIIWLLSLAILLGFVLFDPNVAAGLARFSFAATTAFAGVIIIYLSLKGYDRAIMLVPSWLLSIAWLAGCWLTISGKLDNDIVQPALGGGLVLLVLLFAFTILQDAFADGGFAQGLVSDVERQALALTGSDEIYWDWDTKRNFIQTGDNLSSILSLPKQALDTSLKNVVKLIHPNDRERFQATLEGVQEHKRGKISLHYRMRGNEGQYHWFHLKARPMLGTDGNVMRCIGAISDVTAQKTAEERLLQDAVKDNLTGLENRELFSNRLDMVIQLSKREASSRPTIFHINIDHFNKENSKIGFAAGDTILLTIAKRLAKLMRAGDSVARLGGDQFAVLLLSETTPERIAAFADTVRKTIQAPIQFGGKEISLTASMGISSWTKEHIKPELMMRDAELAMLHAKRLGGNRIEPFRPAFRTGKDDSVILVDDLRLALRDKSISVLYQPIMKLSDGSIQGYEALVRWQHPKLGLVSPSDFIPIAESSGQISELGKYVIEKATKEFSELRKSIPGFNGFVSVNISSRELLRDEIVHDIENALKASALPASALKIEVTESLVMENPEFSAQVLKRVKALDVGLSLDDFGTGYSSLSYLMKFPFDIIKIDSSFIRARDLPERLTMLRSIIAMAHGLGHSLIAEGIEHESDLKELRQLKCEFGQGFLFGEATPIEKVKYQLEAVS